MKKLSLYIMTAIFLMLTSGALLAKMSPPVSSPTSSSTNSPISPPTNPPTNPPSNPPINSSKPPVICPQFCLSAGSAGHPQGCCGCACLSN